MGLDPQPPSRVEKARVHYGYFTRALRHLSAVALYFKGRDMKAAQARPEDFFGCEAGADSGKAVRTAETRS